MQRVVLRSKTRGATVTDADLESEGSCAIDPVLLRAADLVSGEQIHIVNVSNGSRAITYAIEGSSGQVGLHGAMAHIGRPGDAVVIVAHAHASEAELEAHRPRVVLVDADNRVREEVAAS
jgi:aspartate 1-decarboxylase